MGDVQIKIQVGKGAPQTFSVPQGTYFMTENGSQAATQNKIIKLSADDKKILDVVAGRDGNNTNITEEDLRKFNALSKAQKNKMIADALKGSKYKLGVVGTAGDSENPTAQGVHSTNTSFGVNTTLGNYESEDTAQYFGLFINKK